MALHLYKVHILMGTHIALITCHRPLSFAGCRLLNQTWLTLS